MSHELRRIERKLDAILIALGILIVEDHVQVTDFALSQIQGDKKMALTGTALGTTSSFNIGFLPANEDEPLQSGPTVAVDDTLAAVTQPDANQDFTVSIPATDTATSYNVTVSGVNGAGQPVSHVFNVPILPAPAVQIADFSLNQLS